MKCALDLHMIIIVLSHDSDGLAEKSGVDFTSSFPQTPPSRGQRDTRITIPRYHFSRYHRRISITSRPPRHPLRLRDSIKPSESTPLSLLAFTTTPPLGAWHECHRRSSDDPECRCPARCLHFLRR